MGALLFRSEALLHRILPLFIAALTFNAWALDLKGHTFTDAYRYSLLEDSYTEKFNDRNVFLGSYAYVRAPFYFTDPDIDDVQRNIIDYNNVLTLGYTRYHSSALAFGIDAVAVQNKVEGESYTSFGDVNLRAKYLLSDRGLPWGLSLNPYITLPTGRAKNYTTAKSLGAGVRAVFERHWNSWHGLGSVGYGYNPTNEYKLVDQRNLLLAQLGLSYDINQSWNANAEVTRNFTVNSDERQDEGDYFLTLKNKTTDSISLYGGAGLAGLQRAEAHNYTVFVGFKLQETEKKAEPAQLAEAPKPIFVKPRSRAEENIYGALIELDNVYFDNNRYNVKPSEMKKLDKVLKLYKQHGKKITKIVVEGYASTRGNPPANLILSKNRTLQVMEELKNKGIPEDLMVSVSYGDQTLQDPDEGKNRKVQFRVYQER